MLCKLLHYLIYLCHTNVAKQFNVDRIENTSERSATTDPVPIVGGSSSSHNVAPGVHRLSEKKSLHELPPLPTIDEAYHSSSLEPLMKEAISNRINALPEMDVPAIVAPKEKLDLPPESSTIMPLREEITDKSHRSSQKLASSSFHDSRVIEQGYKDDGKPRSVSFDPNVKEKPSQVDLKLDRNLAPSSYSDLVELPQEVQDKITPLPDDTPRSPVPSHASTSPVSRTISKKRRRSRAGLQADPSANLPRVFRPGKAKSVKILESGDSVPGKWVIEYDSARETFRVVNKKQIDCEY